MGLLHITDRTNSARDAIVDGDTVAPLVGGWLAADGVTEDSRTVRGLERALRRGDWNSVHAIADYLSITVDAV